MLATNTLSKLEFPFPSAADLAALCREEGPCVSIFAGPHKAGSGTRPLSTTVAGMMPRIAPALAACGMRPIDIEDLLRPLEKLAADPGAEEGHRDPICLFLSPGGLHCFSVRAVVEPGWHVEERFVIGPVLEHLDYRQTFLLLALAGKRIRLLRYDHGEVETLPIPEGVPESTSEFAHEQSPADVVKGHAFGVRFAAGEGRERGGAFRQNFMKAIDRGLLPMYRALRLPLVLAGVEEETAAYLAVSDYAELLPEPVQMSPDGGATNLELVAAAEQIMKRWGNVAEKQALGEYRHMGLSRRSDRTADIVKAAIDGRVLHLFVARGEQARGPAQSAGRVAYVYRNDNLMNAAMVEVLRHKGNVWLLEPDTMPDGSAMAAVLRYAGEKTGMQ